jgi:hypothetical protein
MRVKTTAVSLVAAAATFATPAVAQDASGPRGKATAPAQLCKAQSKKKTNHGKGKSPFAACVIGVKRATAEHDPTPSTKTAPGTKG